MFEPKSPSSHAPNSSSFLTERTRYPFIMVALLLLSVAVLYIIPAFYFPLFDMDEGAYAAVSREMAVSGNWWVTMLNGEPFFHKPVLMYWSQALGLTIFGEARFAYRVPSLIALGIWLWATYGFVKQYIDHETAWLAVWIAVFSSGVAIIFKAAIPDAWLILFISLAFYKAYDFLQTEQVKYLYWAFFWTGFGMLAKGPIALVIVAGSLLIYLVLGRQWPLLKTMILAWKGWLLLLLVALPWYVVQVVLFGEEFIHEFFGVHNIGRFTNPMEGHSGNPLYYLLALVLLTLPFFPILIKSLLPWWRRSKESGLWRLLAIWFLWVLLFFTLAATKLPHYLMYGVPPVIIAMAYYARHHRSNWGLGVTLLVLSAFLSALPWLIEFALQGEKNPYHVESFGQAVDYIPTGYFFWMALLAVTGLLVMLKRWSMMTKVILSGAVMTLTLNFAILSYASVLQQQPIVEAAEFVKKHQLSVVTCCIEMPSFNVEAQQITPTRLATQGEVVFGKTYEIEKRFTEVEWLWRGRGVSIARVIKE